MINNKSFRVCNTEHPLYHTVPFILKKVDKITETQNNISCPFNLKSYYHCTSDMIDFSTCKQ